MIKLKKLTLTYYYYILIYEPYSNVANCPTNIFTATCRNGPALQLPSVSVTGWEQLSRDAMVDPDTGAVSELSSHRQKSGRKFPWLPQEVFL